MSARPNAKSWIVMIVISLAAVVFGIAMNHDRRDLKASLPGQLDQQYSVETETRNGVETRRTYHLNYTFEVNGKSYHGSDTLDTEPSEQECAVFFDPNNPEINGLSAHPVDTRFTTLTLVMAGVVLICGFILSAGPGRNEPLPPPPLPGQVGDAAGEYLMMSRGNYDATGYVTITFLLQLFLIGWGGKVVLEAISGGHIPVDLISVCTFLTASLYTLWVFWDRWRCIAAYASQYTSGCANITILYMPFVVCGYANYRGLLKLKGR